MPSIKPFIKNDYVKSDGKANIKIRVCHKGQTRFISTDWSIEPRFMSPDGRVKDSYPNAAVMNMNLNNLVNEYYQVIDKIGLDIRFMSCNTLADRLKNKELAISFTKFMKSYMDEVMDGRDSSLKMYNYTLKNLTSFAGGDIYFSSIDLQFIDKFDIYLQAKGQGVNTRRLIMAIFKTVIKVAIDRGTVNIPNPFRKFKIKYQKPKKRNMPIKDLRQLMSGTYSDAKQRSVDIFMLSIYLNGLNFKDMVYLKPENVKNGRLQIYRKKTGEPLSIKIFPEAQKILDKYKGEKYLLSFLDKDDSYDNYMDILGRIDFCLRKTASISMYWARHTISSILADLDIPIDTISMVLGHTLPGSPMTELYITFNLKKVDDAMEKAIAHINDTKTDSSANLKAV